MKRRALTILVVSSATFVATMRASLISANDGSILAAACYGISALASLYLGARALEEWIER